MKSERYQQFDIIRESSAQMLTDRLNQRLYELRHKSPEVEIRGDQALIRYIETEEAPETLGDEYKTMGVHLECRDCPFFEPPTKADGTEDKRAKWGDCIHAHYGRTSQDSPACDKLFQMLNNKEVRICLAD